MQNWQNPSFVQFHSEQGPASIIHHLFLPTLYISVPSLLLDRKELSLWKTASDLHGLLIPLDVTVFSMLFFVASHHRTIKAGKDL